MRLKRGEIEVARMQAKREHRALREERKWRGTGGFAGRRNPPGLPLISVVANPRESPTLSGHYCHVEETVCEAAREDRAVAGRETGFGHEDGHTSEDWHGGAPQRTAPRAIRWSWSKSWA